MLIRLKGNLLVGCGAIRLELIQDPHGGNQKCTMVPRLLFWGAYILSVILSVFPPYRRKCVPVYVHQAESSRWQWGSQVIPELWVLGMGLASCYPSGTWKLDLAPELMENFWLSGTDCVCLDVQSVLFTVNAVRTSMLLVHLFCCLLSLKYV